MLPTVEACPSVSVSPQRKSGNKHACSTAHSQALVQQTSRAEARYIFLLFASAAASSVTPFRLPAGFALLCCVGWENMDCVWMACRRCLQLFSKELGSPNTTRLAAAASCGDGGSSFTASGSPSAFLWSSLALSAFRTALQQSNVYQQALRLCKCIYVCMSKTDSC